MLPVEPRRVIADERSPACIGDAGMKLPMELGIKKVVEVQNFCELIQLWEFHSPSGRNSLDSQDEVYR